MESCLIIINKSAGTSDKISFDYVKKRLGDGYKYSCHTIPNDGEPNLDGYSALAVCGGDGTLSNVLNKVYDKQKSVYYFPSGTLNDKAKSEKHTKGTAEHHAVVGIAGGDVFSYVFAAGSFTPIGYTASIKMKKRFGILAYLAQVVKEYKVHRINATITVGDNTYAGDFTLIMLLKSSRCFGFNFNKAYDEQKESGHLILIRSPKHDGLLGKIEMFFPFFRVFFMGLKKEREGTIIFKETPCANINLPCITNFCKDGEKSQKQGEFEVCFKKTECNVNTIKR